MVFKTRATYFAGHSGSGECPVRLKFTTLLTYQIQIWFERFSVYNIISCEQYKSSIETLIGTIEQRLITKHE